MKHLSAKIPDELLDRIDRAAQAYMRNRSNLTIFALDDWLKQHGYAEKKESSHGRMRKQKRA
jgi:metal-responsive CopG/Arc/MetJ family transcriptional regulator